ncbi:spore germination protein [Paenibacillus thermotolerans]|uniref:spore germination protein n=1 Tax=Paenibacillus thermotolerans TaxID=3027807 RepID=UPI0023682589|nr:MULTISPECIES: spore germination protein [unclassified Paenibacillus]
MIMTDSAQRFPISEEDVRRLFQNSSDIEMIKIVLPQGDAELSVLLVYCAGLCDTSGLYKQFVPILKKAAERFSLSDPDELEKHVPYLMAPLSTENLKSELTNKVLEGDLILLFETSDQVYAVKMGDPPKRNPDEPNTEVSTRGPKDGFTEETMTNIGLIRKRLKTNQLAVEEHIIGSQTSTKVSLLYLQHVIDQAVLREIQTKIKSIRADGIISSTQLEELLTGFSLFPKYSYTGRPDFAVNSLMNGRFVLFAEGSPTAIIAPVNFSFLLNTSEDAHMVNSFVMFIRLLRILGIIISLFLPGFFIALLTFHQDQLPFTLLATLVTARQGVPFPVPLEALIMLILFEIFREAGMRLPSAFGQTLSVVGGLIIGQAAISAGIAAPGTTVVIAISVLSTFSLVNQSLVGVVSLIRIFVLIVGGIFGLFGVLVCLMAVVLYMVNLRSFGTYYLSPISPPSARDLYKVIARMPWGKKN